MAIQQFLLAEEVRQWKEQIVEDPKSTARGSFKKLLSDGLEGRPEAFLTTIPEGFKNRAHFHSEAQFQVVLEGNVTFPAHALKAIAVHYSDAYTAYGPFVGESPFKYAVLRPRKCLGKGHMDNPEERNGRDPRGREFFGQAKDVPWSTLTDELAGMRRKVLFGREDQGGPQAQLWECASGTAVQRNAAPFGEYQILITGSARLRNHEVMPYSMHYAVGDDAPTPLAAGPEGATWLLLTFDQEATKRSTLLRPERPG